MRRPRTKLQVSTFPFLAVLLGAMGSLIFLLLVMDRRAKIVARNKVRATVEARLADAQKADQERRDAWEEQRARLHTALAAEDHEWRARLHDIAGPLTSAARAADAERAAEGRLLEAMAREQQALAEAKQRLQNRQALLLKSTQVEETTRIELARLSRELVELQEAADALKRLKQQQRPTYSLVPYRGQRGAHRIPVYVECTGSGLAFLPEGKTLPGADLDIVAFRAEVERRHGPLVKQEKNADPFRTPESDQPYVLFLVRPDGVPIYYRAQSALRGFEIDYGYELVDADWTLNVPTAAEFAKLGAEETAPAFRSAAGGANHGGVAAGGSGAGGSGAGGSGAGGPGKGGPGKGGPGMAMSPGAGNGKGIGTKPAPPLALQADPPGFGTLGNPDNSSPRAPAPPGPTPPGLAMALPRTGAAASVKPSPAAPTVALGAPQGAAGQGSPGETGTDSAPAAPGPPSNATAPDESASGNPGVPLASPLAGAPEKKPTPLPRGIGKSEFVINLACYADGVVVTPGGAAFNWTTARDPRQLETALVHQVSQLITRRQASARPGEPPQRVVLRFVVHREGLRSMYRVYPLLEGFRLPMVRENVEE